CKTAILGMISAQIDEAVDRYLDEDFGPASFAEFASNRLSIEFESYDFRKCEYAEAERIALAKAQTATGTFIQEALDECLSADEDSKEWKWQELTRRINVRYGLKTTDRELKQVGRDGLPNFLHEQCVQALQQVDLKDGAKYLHEDWTTRSICDWAKQKFLLKVTQDDLVGKDGREIKTLLHDKVTAQYRQKEIEFPVTVAMANYMAERATQPGAQKYNREGLFAWARLRFPEAAESLKEDDFRTLSRSKLYELLL